MVCDLYYFLVIVLICIELMVEINVIFDKKKVFVVDVKECNVEFVEVEVE